MNKLALSLSLLAISCQAQTTTLYRAVMVDTNGVVVQPTNFHQANPSGVTLDSAIQAGSNTTRSIAVGGVTIDQGLGQDPIIMFRTDNPDGANAVIQGGDNCSGLTIANAKSHTVQDGSVVDLTDNLDLHSRIGSTLRLHGGSATWERHVSVTNGDEVIMSKATTSTLQLLGSKLTLQLNGTNIDLGFVTLTGTNYLYWTLSGASTTNAIPW